MPIYLDHFHHMQRHLLQVPLCMLLEPPALPMIAGLLRWRTFVGSLLVQSR